MKLPIWYQAKNGKWVPLTYFPDGQVGLTMDEAMKQDLIYGYGLGMGKLDPNKVYFEGGSGPNRRFLLRKVE